VVAPSLRLGDAYLLATITAVVIGGTAFGGGRARLVGAAVAALFLTQLNSLLSAIGAPPSTSLVLQALAIAIAVGVGPIIDRIRHVRRLRALARGQRAVAQ
jgi:ribose transport system permease protein